MPRSIVVRHSSIHGNGVFAAADLPAGKSLIEYRGKLLRHAVADRRYSGNVDTGHTFLFILNDHYVIDGTEEGNDARWINHSCSPNCEPVLLESKNGDPAADRLFIETTRAVKAGEELTYDYGIELEQRYTRKLKQTWACRCGSKACIGTMLAPKAKKKPAPKATKTKAKTKAKAASKAKAVTKGKAVTKTKIVTKAKTKAKK